MNQTITKISLFACLLGGICFFNSSQNASAICSVTEETEKNDSQEQKSNIYHFDAVNGNDKNDGLSDSTAWKSVFKLRRVKLQAGDKVLFKRGQEFEGRISLSGEGTETQPIIIGAYGEGTAKPIIKAPDHSPYAVRIGNSSYLTLQDLDIVNHGSTESAGRTGVLLECKDYGTSRGIRLNNLTVRDVNGSMVKKEGAGSGILIKNGGDKKISIYDGLTIEYCHVKNCYRNAIIWDGYWDRTNWHPNLNVLVRYNLIEEVPGDGIVPIGCDGAIIEYNVMRNGVDTWPDPEHSKEAAAGFWPWASDNTVIRFNEVSDHKAPWDGQGFDADYSCTGTLIEYNYSHDNYGGMVLVCAAGDEAKFDYCWGNEKPVVRYNISIGDGNRPRPTRGKMFSPSIHIGGPVNDLLLYRNIVHNKKKADSKIDKSMIVSDDWVGYANRTVIKENIFYTPETSRISMTKSRNNKFQGNYYVGRFSGLPSENPRKTLPDEDKELVSNPGEDGLMQFMDSVTIANNAKCYFVNKQKVEEFFDNVVTGIEEIEAEQANKEVVYYDLTGRKVLRPTHGLYVRNDGEKVYIK